MIIGAVSEDAAGLREDAVTTTTEVFIDRILDDKNIWKVQRCP